MRDVSELVRSALQHASWTEPRVSLTVTVRELNGEPVPLAEAVSGEFVPAALGTRWGRPWDTAWFRLQGTVPHEWAGARVVADLDLGWPDEHPGFSLEALVYRDGEPMRGICRFHEEVVVSRGAVGGEGIDLLVEAAANPGSFPGAPRGVQQSADRIGELRRADLVRVSPDRRRARVLLELLLEARGVAAGPRLAELDAALRAAADQLLEGTAPEDVLPGLEKVLGGAPESRPVVHPVANSHLDTAWLWPVRETRRKVARTLSTALETSQDHPGHTFAVSQPQQLAWLEQDHPGLFRRVQDAVAGGRIEMVGVSWVEPDTNVPSGESLVRQLTAGARYLRERFGVAVGGLWLPDVFGYSGQVPQLLRQAGLEWFMTSKLGMNDTNAFPHRTFWWEGIDGSRVLAHLPPADTYNGSTALDQVRAAAAVVEDTSGHALYLYGYGDGGGGPTREMVERVELLGDLREAPATTRGTVHSFFEELARDARALPVWVGELYFELHRGTYTTQSETKTWHRRAEQALLEAELWAAASGAEVSAEIRNLWADLLLQQFHDILPGSSIGWVHDEAVTTLRRVVDDAEALGQRCFEKLVGPGTCDVVVNAAGVMRAEVVDGRWVEAPALGWGAVGSGELPAEVATVVVGAASFENGLVRVEWDPVTGHLISVFDLLAGREALTGPGNVLQLHDDHPRFWDAWDLERRDTDRPRPIDDVVAITVEADALTATLRVERRHGRSHYVQAVELRAGSPLVRCTVDVDWQERHTLLKVAFPVSVRAPYATYEIQYGSLTRPTHRNTSWDTARFEVCAQRWADLSEQGYGVALLNRSRHGYDVRGSTMRLSLLRSPTWPDPDADLGAHHIEYALLPHSGDIATGGVVAAAEAYNRPLRIIGARAAAKTTSVVSSSEAGVMVSAVKPADDGDGVVVRVYEAWGGRRRAVLRTSLPVSEAVRCDLHEVPTDTPVLVDDGLQLELGPFEVRTLRLR